MKNAKIIERTEQGFVVATFVPYKRSMLESEEAIQAAVNASGSLMTEEALEQFDTDGSPLIIGDTKWTTKGKVSKTYQTPYGEATIARHVYQSPRGGKTFCPLDQDARIILTATPKFAKMLSSKYTEFGASRVIEDLEANHQRKVARSFVQNVCDAIGTIVFAKEEHWEYELPKLEKPTKIVSIGLDGTCMHLAQGGYRQTMVGTITLYDKDGKRQHTIYTAASPEHGRKTFIDKFSREVERIKQRLPEAYCVGLADGAKENWEFLEKRTETQIIDFWHVTEYLNEAADAIFPTKDKIDQKNQWIEKACHNLKHKSGEAKRLSNELKRHSESEPLKEGLKDAMTYFKNHKHKMNYPEAIEQGLPIGSGVTEAACKVIVKQRLCNSGMRWKERGAAVILSMRALNYTKGRWDQFWHKIDRYGFPVAA